MSNNLSAPNGPGRPKDPAKRRAILDAAKTLFLSHGYANTSMDAVAAEAGVSKLTVYSHFNDKETLFSSAVMAKCEEQLPPLFFELPAGIPVENVLLNIARGFHQLINSDESVNLHRLMMALGTQDPKLSQIFFDAGPERMVQGMERLLKRIDETGVLSIDLPRNAAEHFFCLLKGAGNFRLLYCCGEPLSEEAAESHVQEVVGLFMRAYRP
ncbi:MULTISPECIES: TetR/AcrR family transcriptional regulator [Pseudomonas]|jgi:TetR/AcrR family transcriptional repressor of mexJK operon|uniref:TetR/AcrR family transcriptional regulator n=1 Tax=Pseudomonas moraviensis TaxID=321662 RepID=A0A2A2PI25_9PSED|nr:MULTISPECIES: TetR/AcrR family transcriptional regulator [Pseudomonas]KIK89896.1 TetR family transcriptional regulator [Pseudomonas sp. W15Feb9B]PAW50752.1 TetR/AcrR family transcriptional regulator [Pseudomonas moraviensis]PAW55259.1 TetR/AcrR family transcriptional regulator [Pseudomonas moraviensis]QXE08509.1 TetR/AcrR family transcriptional regulator [Pseudomonas sp. AN-B15]QXZ13210.1 TetR/AcrR family transcriptional regulator [Pseudomonas sp. AO-1]